VISIAEDKEPIPTKVSDAIWTAEDFSGFQAASYTARLPQSQSPWCIRPLNQSMRFDQRFPVLHYNHAMPIMPNKADAELNYLIDQAAFDFALEREQEFLDERWAVIWRMGCRICGAPESWRTEKDYQGPFQDTVDEIYDQGLRKYEILSRNWPI
jgi:hypothetical protein